MENDITFPTTFIREDLIFSFKSLCLANNFVHIPNVVNIYRVREESVSHTDNNNIDLEPFLNKWTKVIIEGVKFFDEFMNSIDFLAKHPELRYGVIDHYVQENISWYMTRLFVRIPPYELDARLRELFSVNPEDNVTLTSYIFSALNMYRIYLIQSNQKIAQLQQKIKELQEAIH